MPTPSWVGDAVFYQILPDRFAKSDRVTGLQSWDSKPTLYGYKGGVFGIIENLEYLKSLGVNAIYLNPIFQAASYHRYNTYDHLQVDPILGGLRELLDRCHALGFKVILDGVFNHCGRGFSNFTTFLKTVKTALTWIGFIFVPSAQRL
jgi:cyclomaltodextrinase